jgi:hypothetical protein
MSRCRARVVGGSSEAVEQAVGLHAGQTEHGVDPVAQKAVDAGLAVRAFTVFNRLYLAHADDLIQYLEQAHRLGLWDWIRPLGISRWHPVMVCAGTACRDHACRQRYLQ